MVVEVCETCFASDVCEHVYLCTSNRLDTVIGKAVYNRAGDIRRRIGRKNAAGIEEADNDRVLAIILNNNVFWHVNNPGKAEIVVHETCHIIDFYLQLIETGRIVAEHGDRWKTMMWACGFPAREFIPHTELGLDHYCRLECQKCNYHINTSKAKFTKHINGKISVVCRTCSQRLVGKDLDGFNLDKRASA